ncbi:MAG TPA: T9SS type A sorting domain-containing protein, partial [Chitinophagales bacterium]|nr:T9SS type A sorting domain-containing protein [Chitinophagales bacterium]
VTNSLAIPMLADLRDKGPYWVLNNYSDSLSKKVVTYQGVDKYAYLSDYSVFANAFHFWDFIAFTPLVRQAFSRVGVNGVMMGWGPDEHTTVYTASQYGLHVHASDWASNLSTYSNFNVSTHQKDNNDDTTVIPGKHTVCFVMTDGDNIQWLLNDFSTNPGWYGSHRRGACNLGWTVSPALAELAPTALKYLYDSAATSPGGRDYFICGPSGLGYYYPSNFNSLDSAAAITQRMMKKAGLSILNVISDGYSDSQMLPYLSQPNIDAVFFYTYDYWYAGLRGFATCINGKPVITPRFAFAGGVYDVQSLADTLNKMPPNPYSSDGYSLIAVNVWSKNIDSVISCVNLLDTNVRVVTPDVFVKLYKAGVNCTTTAINSTVQNAASLALSVSPNPARALALVNFTLPSTGIVTLSVYNMQGQEINTVFNGQLAAGQQQVKILTGQLPAGVYICRLNYNGSSQTATMVIAR